MVMIFPFLYDCVVPGVLLVRRLTPALLVRKCLLPRDTQRLASFGFGEAGPDQVVFAGKGASRLIRAELLHEGAPEVQQRLDRQSRTPSFV